MLHRREYLRLVLFLIFLVILLILLGVCVGRFSFDPRDALGALWDRLAGNPINKTMDTVVFVIRIPRILAALLIGAALAVSGAVYQSVFRNPLVSPDLLGVSSGASLGAACAILFGAGIGTIQVYAFCGGIIAVALAVLLPRLLRNSTNLMMVLSGIIVSSFMNAMLGVLKFIAEERTDLASIVFWQMGSLTTVSTPRLSAITPPILVCGLVVLALSWRLNILSLGEEEARTVGINVQRLRGIFIVCASLLTASAVSVSGTIGWIGLVIPHLGRLLCGSDNTKLLPVTALLGGSFLLVIDTVARAATSVEIPLSILSGLLGAPFYVWLLQRQRAKIL
ncbi:MAG: iron ABC transporter permease [Symbiobacteriaceae bacterium]|nr:iron ABC transporter permease [Symbiobacteriaceae bacterium]